MIKRVLKYMVSSVVALVFCLVLGACILLNRPQFGGSPAGPRLDAIHSSEHFVDGEFKNLITTPKFTEDFSAWSMLRDDLLNPRKRLVPDAPIPSVKTDLKGLDPTSDVVVWLGHSSFFMQLGGKRILLDPIFSTHAAPFSFFNKAFVGTNIYGAGDVGEIDALLISHDHWDHLDYATVVALKEHVHLVVCPLGVGAYFESWGYAAEKIREADWYEHVDLEDDVTIRVVPARHYSGRSFRQNKTLWAGFALESPESRLFFSGDSGYGPHFAEIGKRFGSFDLVALDCGQYDDRWAAIHMTPEEAVKAAKDLNSKMFLPSHIGRFAIARHEWDDPFFRVVTASEGEAFQLCTPEIGQPVRLGDKTLSFTHWWEKMEPPG